MALIYCLLFILLIFLVSKHFSNQDVAKNLKPYVWGYFLGYSLIVAGVCNLMLLSFDSTQLLYILITIGYIIIGLSIVFRSKYGWMAIFSLLLYKILYLISALRFEYDPTYIIVVCVVCVVMLLNIGYVSNRWRQDLKPNNKMF